MDRPQARLELLSARTCQGTRAGIARAFLVSRAYLQIAQEFCRDVLKEDTSPEAILQTALWMLKQDLDRG